MIKEIEKLLNPMNVSINFRYMNIGGNFLYVEGIKSFVELSEIKVQFQLKKNVLEVLGKGLKVKYLDKTTSVIEGEIISVVTK